MDKYQKYLEKQNKNLKFLLEFEMLERRQIAGDFHGKSAGMIGARLYVDALAKKDSRLHATTVVLKSLLDEAIESFRNVSRKIHPKDSERYGILSGINDYVKRNLEVHKDIQITNTSTLYERLDLCPEHEMGIYKICIVTLDLLLTSGFRKIDFGIHKEGQHLVFVASGTKYKRWPAEMIYDHTIPGKLLLKAVKTMISLQKAKALPETNWKNSFKYKFDLGKFR